MSQAASKLGNQLRASREYSQRSTGSNLCRVSLPRNINRTEQVGSAVIGSALVMSGLRRGGASGLLSSLIGGALLYRGMTGHCHGYSLVGVDTSHRNYPTSVPAQQGVKIEQSIIVNRKPEELFVFWKNLENLPAVFRHLDSVKVTNETHSHWVARGPFNRLFEWDAELFNVREPELIAWRSLPGSQVDSAGSVRFQALGHNRGTSLTVSLKYNPPAGKLGAAIASMLGQGMEQELDEDLRQFKSRMETGEVATIAGQPRGA